MGKNALQNPSFDLKRNAESARYALLRRLAVGIRHDMAGGFQPVNMMATILEKRLLMANPDFSTLVKSSTELRSLVISATYTSLELIGWLTIEPKARVALGKGIADVLHLVSTELSFRGFKLVNQTLGEAAEVRLDSLRGVFVATLLAVTDSALLPANVLISTARAGQDFLLTISLSDVDASTAVTEPRDEFQIGLAAYRKINWDDVQAIADADGMSVKREANSATLRLAASTA